ncbi:MAG: Ig-like domain-containing protein [Clostridiales bacterium]|nr:Ig-like domain-containing protein [Clostridiales bacterium]
MDCLAAQGNDKTTEQAPLVYEGSYSGIQSKKKAVRRSAFADTDNNATDCVEIDYSGTVSADNGPHVGTYVAGKDAQTVTVTDASGNSVTSETTISLTKGDTYQITAAASDNGTIAYTSSNPSCVTVSETGEITALGVGTATITVTAAETESYAAGTASFAVRVSKVDQGYTLKKEGFTNGSSGSVDLTKLGSYVSGVSDADGGVTEIISYDSANNTAWSVNGKTGMLEIIDLKTLTCDLSDADTDNLTAEELDVKSLMAEAYPDFFYGDMTSVSINSDLGIAAVALQAEGYADNGYVALIDTISRELLTAIEVGCQPDMVCFTPDGTKILSANEGEPREGYGSGTTDPLGSVSIITLDTDNLSASAVKTVDFTAYDSQREALVSAGVILAKGVSVSADLEPEYIAATDTTAYVVLQEANAIAVLDLDSGAFTGIYSLGYKDLSMEANAIDLIDDGDYVAKTYPDAIVAYMPDGISIYTVGGQTYILTANEGDSREWGSYSNESKTTLTASDGSTAEKVRTINADVTDGLPSGKTVLFGGRSFSIYQVSSGGLTQVYDSANDFEKNTAKYVASYFNCSNDDNDYDSRSQKKGPEPETVTVGTVGSRTYAFIALERVGGIMMYDITDPSNAYFVNYINSRDYLEDPSSGASLSSDISPEGLYFISAEASVSGTPILLTAFEVSGTVAAYAVGDTPTGHTYGEPAFHWATDHSSCTAVFTCSKCGDEETVNCTVTTATTAATAAENGSTVYTATCVFNNTEYSDEYSEVIAATGTSGGSAESATVTQTVMQSLTDDVISNDLKAIGF